MRNLSSFLGKLNDNVKKCEREKYANCPWMEKAAKGKHNLTSSFCNANGCFNNHQKQIKCYIVCYIVVNLSFGLDK